jgi:hypothetical protein
MSQSTELKTKLENAVRLTHQQQAQRQSKMLESTKPQLKVPAPSITLKTDFSNFN